MRPTLTPDEFYPLVPGQRIRNIKTGVDYEVMGMANRLVFESKEVLTLDVRWVGTSANYVVRWAEKTWVSIDPKPMAVAA